MKIIRNGLKTLAFLLGSFVLFGNMAMAALPTIVTPTAQIGKKDVVLEGYVNPNGYLTTAWFEYGTLNNQGDIKETTHLDIGAGIYSTHFSANITDLATSTTYFFRTVANNGQINVKGDTMYFTTGTSLPQNVPIGSNTDSLIFEQQNFDTITMTGSAIMNSSFLPQTLTGWLLLVLVILCTIFMVQKLRNRNHSNYPTFTSTGVPRKPL